MKILKVHGGALTNFEVLDLLRSRGASKDPTRVMSIVTPSEFKVYDYLVESAACNQTRESINEFLEKSKKYELAKAEVLNIINIRPTSAVELAPIIEELDSDKGKTKRQAVDDALEEIVEMVVEVLPPHPNEQNVDDEATEDDLPQEADEDNVEGGEDEMEAS